MRSRKRWISAAYTRNQDRPGGYYQTIVLYSDDDGDTWRETPIKSAPSHTAVWPHRGVRWQNGSSEPTITELADGTLYMITRTSQDYDYQYYSYDGGETWTDPEPSCFHSTIIMPTLYRLSDGRILFLWCNTQPLPELRHENQWPPLNKVELIGGSEDVFTNRDANHAAISEDDGKTWIGFRELWLNNIRNDADFRTKGANDDTLDKSLHQMEVLELPYGKVLVTFGQHPTSRKMIIFDPAWLYEKKREETFRTGMGAISTQVYLKSVSGNYRGFSGHCAWNRTNGAVMVPDPDGNFEEALLLVTTRDPRLFSNIQGAVWNFPAAGSGKVTVRLRIYGEGLRLSLMDRWFNPVDTTVDKLASYSCVITKNDVEEGTWTDVTITWKGKEAKALVEAAGKLLFELKAQSEHRNGISYIHLQSLPVSSAGQVEVVDGPPTGKEDYQGSLIKRLNMEAF
jgi:hypothetical protein